MERRGQERRDVGPARRASRPGRRRESRLRSPVSRDRRSPTRDHSPQRIRRKYRSPSTVRREAVKREVKREMHDGAGIDARFVPGDVNRNSDPVEIVDERPVKRERRGRPAERRDRPAERDPAETTVDNFPARAQHIAYLNIRHGKWQRTGDQQTGDWKLYEAPRPWGERPQKLYVQHVWSDEQQRWKPWSISSA